MITKEKLIASLEKYGSCAEDTVLATLGIRPDRVRECAVLAPWWLPDMFGGMKAVDIALENAVDNVMVFDAELMGRRFTYVRAGIGAPVTMDVLLALGLTPCKRLLFVGSAGSLSPDIAIGDIVIPEYTVCGDGASRYIGDDAMYGDVFGQRAYPDAALYERLVRAAKAAAEDEKAGARLHIGRAFAVDTILAQFVHLEEIMALGCDTIEMETAAVFRGARLMGMEAAALFLISDNSVLNSSLMSPVDAALDKRRRDIRKKLFPDILVKTLF